MEIADRMIQVVPAITGLIDRLEKQELVTRRRCEEDRRVVYVEITAQALKILAELDQPLEELHMQLLANMNKSELTELIRLLEKSRAN